MISLALLLLAAEPSAVEEAEAFLAAGLYRDALASAQKAPDSSASLLLRAKARRALVLNPPADRALAAASADYDYARLARELDAVAKDFTGAGVAVDAKAAATLAARARGFETQVAADRAKLDRDAADEIASVRAGAAARIAQRKVEAVAEYDRDYGSRISYRTGALALLLVGVALGAVSVGTYFLGNAQVDSIRNGGLATGGQIQARASEATALRFVSLGTLIAAGISEFAGLLLRIANPAPPEPPPGGASL